MPRIAPLEPPYAPDKQKLFDRVMPPGMEPLLLFRTLARNDRLFPRFMGAGVLDRGPLAIRDRELAILRTCARCRCEYEWGVHVMGFGRPLGIPDAVLRATAVADDWRDPVWSPPQAAIVRTCDELHDAADLSDAAWAALREHFDEAQATELIYIAGMYHSVSFLIHGLRVELEPGTPRFADL